MLVAAHTLYEIAMNQYEIDAEQTWTSFHQLSLLGKVPLTGSKYQSLHILITALEVNLMAIMIQPCNYQFPPVNQTT